MPQIVLTSPVWFLMSLFRPLEGDQTPFQKMTKPDKGSTFSKIQDLSVFIVIFIMEKSYSHWWTHITVWVELWGRKWYSPIFLCGPPTLMTQRPSGDNGKKIINAWPQDNSPQLNLCNSVSLWEIQTVMVRNEYLVFVFNSSKGTSKCFKVLSLKKNDNIALWTKTTPVIIYVL